MEHDQNIRGVQEIHGLFAHFSAAVARGDVEANRDQRVREHGSLTVVQVPRGWLIEEL